MTRTEREIQKANQVLNVLDRIVTWGAFIGVWTGIVLCLLFW